MTGTRSAPRRSPLLALALGAAVGLTGGGAGPATAAGVAGSGTAPRLAVAAVASATPAAPLVVPETLTVRTPVAPPTTPPGVPLSPWQLADPSAGPVAGDVEGDPEAVAVPPSLEVTEALQRLRDDADEASTTGGRPARAALVAMGAALDQVGDPYVWGASGPDAFDCSGLTSWSYAQAGVVIPRVSRDQYAAGGELVDVADLLPGDLVFFATADWDPGVVHHVGMYVGHGLMVAAPRPGLTVRVEPVPAADYVGAVRPVPARTSDARDAARATAVAEPTPTVGRTRGLPASTPTPSPASAAGPVTAPSPPATGTPAGPTTGPPTPSTPSTPPPGSATPTTPTATPTPTPTPTASATVLPTLSPVVGPVLVAPVLVSPVVTATLVAVPPPLPREISR